MSRSKLFWMKNRGPNWVTSNSYKVINLENIYIRYFDLNLLVRHYVWEFILNHIHGYLLYLFKYKNFNLLQNILLNLIP